MVHQQIRKNTDWTNLLRKRRYSKICLKVQLHTLVLGGTAVIVGFDDLTTPNPQIFTATGLGSTANDWTIEAKANAVHGL